MQSLYTFAILCYKLLLNILATFHAKAKLFLNGRKNNFAIIDVFNKSRDFNKELFWFHCASLGEFEQARPIIETLKKQNKNCYIALTFFSPSGYEIRKNYEHAHLICYLPFDLPSETEKFVNKLKPQKVFFIKYEIWHNLLITLNKQNIATFFVSILLRKNHYLFKLYSAWFLNNLKFAQHFFCQNIETQSLLNQHQITNTSISGDTRFDRVNEIALQSKPIPELDDFKNKKNIVAGSTWKKDIDIIAKIYMHKFLENYTWIIAPHQINKGEIKYIVEKLSAKKIQYLSNYNSTIPCDILIIDSIGLLSSLYKFSYIAYVGGGFGKAVHNTLEAAVYGIPILIGPNHTKFYEIQEQLTLGNILCINNSVEFLQKIFIFQNNKEIYSTCCQTSFTYVQQKLGATNHILNYIQAN